MRGVVKPVPRQPEEPEDGTQEDIAAQEPETTESQMPTDMNALFANLMKAG